MASSSESVSSPFHQMAAQSLRFVIETQNSIPGMADAIARKNFFGTLQHVKALSHFGPTLSGEHDRTGYGASSLYLKVMREVVVDLLGRFQFPLESWEFAVMDRWLEMTESVQETAAIFDYFRARLPETLTMLADGQNPTNSAQFEVMSRLKAPTESELNGIARYIVEKIHRLKSGEMFAIAGGTTDHEAVVSIKKDLQGEVSIWLFDPYCKLPFQVVPFEGNDVTELAFWIDVCQSKLSDDVLIPFQLKRVKECVDRKMTLDIQIGYTCFAHCHWSFLRHFLIQNRGQNESFRRIREIEWKIKESMFERCSIRDAVLLNFAQRDLEKQRSLMKIASDPKAVAAATLRLLQLLDPSRIRVGSRQVSVRDAQNALSDSFQRMSCLSGHPKGDVGSIVESIIFSNALRCIESNVDEMKSELNSILLPPSKINPHFIRYLELVHAEVHDLNN